MTLVVVDPGHGGGDPGAVGHDGTRESRLALKVAQELAIELARKDIRARLTRTEDVGVSLADRARLANTERAAAFVSVHLNASPNTTVRGAWVLHAKGSRRGRELARSIYRALVPASVHERVYPDESGWTGDRRLAVLRLTRMPAVLVECGFISSPAELAQMQAPIWPTETAEKIADGVAAWIEAENENGGA